MVSTGKANRAECELEGEGRISVSTTLQPSERDLSLSQPFKFSARAAVQFSSPQCRPESPRSLCWSGAKTGND